MDSSTIKGLNPGFFIVVAAIPADEEVANTLAAFIRKKLQGAYVRRVEVEAPEALRLLAIDRVTVSEPSIEPVTYTLLQEGATNNLPRGRSRVSPDKGLVIPFTVDPGKHPRFFIDESHGDTVAFYCDSHEPEKLRQGLGPEDPLVFRVPEMVVGCMIAGD